MQFFFNKHDQKEIMLGLSLDAVSAYTAIILNAGKYVRLGKMSRRLFACDGL